MEQTEYQKTNKIKLAIIKMKLKGLTREAIIYNDHYRIINRFTKQLKEGIKEKNWDKVANIHYFLDQLQKRSRNWSQKKIREANRVHYTIRQKNERTKSSMH